VSSHAVVWSGGADSTASLYYWAGISGRSWPVRALTVVDHKNINTHLLKAQTIVQKRFLKLAEKRKLHISHERLIVKGNCHAKNSTQAEIWLCHLFPYFHDDETIHFGYVRRDDFWHFHERFKRTFDALASAREKPPILELDREWKEKWEILKYLHDKKIPDNCWWSCEMVKKNLRACGECKKCKEVALGRKDLRENIAAGKKKIKAGR